MKPETMTAFSSNKISKFEYPKRKEVFPSNQKWLIEQAKFTLNKTN